MIDLHNNFAVLLSERSVALVYSGADHRSAVTGVSLCAVTGALHESFSIMPATVGLGSGRQMHCVGGGCNVEA